jgi:hypothetical protein
MAGLAIAGVAGILALAAVVLIAVSIRRQERSCSLSGSGLIHRALIGTRDYSSTQRGVAGTFVRR